MKSLFGVILFAGFLSVCLCDYLLHSVEGEVGRGNYTYYSLMYEGPVSLKLYTLAGDADLYISQYLSKPTFDIDSHCLQSASCGVDIIDIPTRFTRPIGIGVYGHPSHELSKYLLEVLFREDEELNPYQEFDDETPDFSRITQSSKSRENSDEDDSYLWSLLWSVTEIVLEMLLL